MHRNSPRVGFTLIELVAVVSIIGVLVALILPAVQSSREAARRTRCASNLREIGLGLAGHTASQSRYPAGILPDGRLRNGNAFANPSAFSVQVQILPYLEQGTLFNSINLFRPSEFNRSNPPSAVSPKNSTAYSTAIDLFLCPSDSSGMALGNNYRATSGPHPALHDGSPWPGGGGVFPGLSFVSERDITDGLSQTVGFSERLRGGGSPGRFNPRRDLWFSSFSSIRMIKDSDDMADVCSSLTASSPSFYPDLGERWIVGTYLDTLYNHVAVPNWPTADCTGGWTIPAVQPGAFSARSAHSGGVHSLLMDGSVRFISQGISLPVWRALSTRAGGEAIGEGSF